MEDGNRGIDRLDGGVHFIDLLGKDGEETQGEGVDVVGIVGGLIESDAMCDFFSMATRESVEAYPHFR